ncbi:hypothetical protein SAMN02745166_03459 [Prosthecobacter debontii]|uniref:Outer membrane lipoprotein-sorting protein n=1 Tax=Prosthecobacter debontii TaxID=48467 RepID=A0A1T4YJR7_9BACT|nr:hypothetical protein [Prosthecobacter debontii]SKB01788.1 hypothetical protein SAMN02745166_03459 [Prosthecobacter debontii]
MNFLAPLIILFIGYSSALYAADEPRNVPAVTQGKKATPTEKSQLRKTISRTLWEVKGAREFWQFDAGGRGTRQSSQGLTTFGWEVNEQGKIATKGGGDPRLITLHSETAGEMLILQTVGGHRKTEITLVPDGKVPSEAQNRMVTPAEKSQIRKTITRALWEVKGGSNGSRDVWWFDAGGKGTRQCWNGIVTFDWEVNDQGEIATKGGGDPRLIILRSETTAEILSLSPGGAGKAAFTFVPDGKKPR